MITERIVGDDIAFFETHIRFKDLLWIIKEEKYISEFEFDADYIYNVYIYGDSGERWILPYHFKSPTLGIAVWESSGYLDDNDLENTHILISYSSKLKERDFIIDSLIKKESD